ncbi:ATP-binding protein [soil metagenome]
MIICALTAFAALALAWTAPHGPATLFAATLLTAAGATLGLWLATRRAAAFQAAVEQAAPALASPFAEALERLPDPFLIVRGGEPDDLSDRRIVFANAAARALPRTPREGALLVTVFRRPEVLEAVDEALFGRTRVSASLEDGVSQTRYWHVFAAPLDNEAPDPREAFALLLLRDETEARRAERTRADFLANASHELRTPLASLSGYIETLRGHAKDDPVARDRFLAIMSAQAERMGRLTEDLLSLSRIELSEHVPPAGRCDLSLATADVVDALQPLIAHKRVRISLHLPPSGSAEVVGDRDQILQVVQNLIDNAAKYSADGGPVRVEVGLAAGEDALAISTDEAWAQLPGAGRISLVAPDRGRAEAGFAFVRVIDEGSGLSRDHLPRLAERFYRVEGQKSGPRSGTGLGLAIVKHIVNRHRGGLLVESAPSHGSRFTAYFPLAAARPEPVAAPVARSAA